MRILVTGGFGYVGGRLAKVLQADGHAVVLGTRRQLSAPPWLPGASVARLDFSDAEQLRSACADTDVVAHLAGMNAQDSTADPTAALAFNGGATARLATAAEQAEVKRFLYLSTAHVYASPLAGVIDESFRPGNAHPYATSHRAGEDAVRSLHERGQVAGVVARLSNAFGAPMHAAVNCWTLLLNELALEAVRSKRMTLRSSGAQQRDFMPLSEACRALAHLLTLPATRLGNGVFNVGGGWSPTVLEITSRLGARVKALAGAAPTITTLPDATGATVEPLSFDRRRLLDSAFKPASPDGIDNEMDGLIRFCVTHQASLRQ